jgi:septum formation protein
MRIILGSSSPRRRELLGRLVSSFEIISPDIEEIPLPDERPEKFCLRAAKDKADEIVRRVGEGEYLIISADTIVTIDGLILGKPKDHSEAVSMLERLQGRTHSVLTALTLIRSHEGTRAEHSAVDTTEVTFLALDREGIEQYLSSITYRDKAGAYAAQENGEMIIGSVNGSMTNVIGFPINLFIKMIYEMGITLSLLM